jgi:hypothetical protein
VLARAQETAVAERAVSLIIRVPWLQGPYQPSPPVNMDPTEAIKKIMRNGSATRPTATQATSPGEGSVFRSADNNLRVPRSEVAGTSK